jgi:glycosyltransferase involved in cell wall biosynthesis
VIPTYQRRGLVSQAIESVLHQTHPADEIIVVDDGSTDGTADAIRREFGERIRVLRQDNRGPAAARNRGVSVAGGDLIAFLDSDDLWLPHHLATIEALATKDPSAVLVSTARNHRYGDEAVDDARCAEMAEKLLLSESVGQTSALAVRRNAFLAVDGYDEQMCCSGEDIDLSLRLSLIGRMSLISATTVKCQASWNSHSRRHRSDGSYAATMGRSPKKVLEELESSSRHDAPTLRAAAAGRLALEEAIASLSVGAPSRVVRSHLALVCGLAPSLRTDPRTIPRTLPYQMPDWEHPKRRLRVLGTLLRAWPQRMSIGYWRLWYGCLLASGTAPGPFVPSTGDS